MVTVKETTNFYSWLMGPRNTRMLSALSLTFASKAWPMGIGLKRFALLVEDHKAKLANVKALSGSLASPGLRTSSWLFESLCDMFL